MGYLIDVNVLDTAQYIPHVSYGPPTVIKFC